MHILITNDDGVHAPGLLALAQAMRPFGRISIVAPDRNWSGRGHVKTLDRPLRVNNVTLADGTAALATDGAPSDCVALALMGLLPQPVDLVIAGINPAPNLGHDVTYSGTVTATMESIILGTPGIAFSLNGHSHDEHILDFQPAAQIAKHVVRQTLDSHLPKGILLNVNIPNLPLADIQGIRYTRQGLRVYRDRLEKRTDPRGRPYYWIDGDTPTGIPDKGTDIGAITNGYVSITPLQLDLTAYPAISALNTHQAATPTDLQTPIRLNQRYQDPILI
ncbi:MAG TPA: 5'/3'-nucleotidase SurE [Anaerolineae bacterium]|nr:5'/3'-nucleotidase SurE [Anaerolineae bacterium]